MNAAEYRNRDALNKALDQYLDAMFQFVSECLDERSIREALRLLSGGDLREKMEVKDIATLIKGNWSRCFKKEFKIVDRDDIRYYDARSVTSLIIEGRNQASHQRLKELDSEFTRSQLFLIAEILGKVKKRDAQRKVESIRDELFDGTAKQLEAVSKAMEDEKAEYKKSIAKVEKRLAVAEENNKELSEQRDDNAAKLGEKAKELEKLSEQFLSVKLSKEKYEEQFNSTSKQLEKVQAAHNTCEECLTSTETERDDYKKRFETASEQLDEVSDSLSITSDQLLAVKVERDTSTEHLTSIQKLLIASTISDQSVFPPLKTDSAVRILDRRGTDKRAYLLELLEQKQPTIIHVQSEEMVDLLLGRVVPEKADLIERHGEQTSEAKEIGILEKLESGELIAVVSDTTFSALTPVHCVEHFVLCHLVPGVDEFYKRCEPAFTSAKNAYLHLIYESKQNVEELKEKYPNEEALRKLYQKFRDRTPTEGKFINPENLYSELCKESELNMTKLGIKTGFSIFEELGFLEQNEKGIRRLLTTSTQLKESKLYCRGEKLREEMVNSPAFQYEQSIDQIWEEILAKLNLDSAQILREGNRYNYGTKDEVSMRHAFPEVPEDSETQSEQSVEAVESGSVASDADTEASQVPKPAPATAKVTEEQVREI